MEKLRQIFRNPAPRVNNENLKDTVHPFASANVEILSPAEEAIIKWESSYVGKDILDIHEYFITMNHSEKEDTKVFGKLRTDGSSTRIDIPIISHRPEDNIRQDLYLNSTFFGTLDPERFKEFVTQYGTKEDVLSFLNTKNANMTPDTMGDWFYDTFQLDHLEKYGDVYVGSHGGTDRYGYNFNVTIEQLKREPLIYPARETQEESLLKAVKYQHQVQKSLPQLEITPLPVSEFLDVTQRTIPFLPQDWESN